MSLQRLHEARPLRKCRYCGKVATTEIDLEQFRKRPAMKHGRDNWCTECFNKAHAVGGKYYEARQRYKSEVFNKKPDEVIKNRVRVFTRYHQNHGDCCEKCSSTENLQMHHLDYNDRLKTVTLCAKCHKGVHNQ